MPQSAKRCNVCQKTKPTTDFYRDASRADQLRLRCKPCDNAIRNGRKAKRRAVADSAGDVAKLVDLVHKVNALPQFGELCDLLDMSPKHLRATIEEARGQGIAIRVTEGDRIGIQADEDDGRIKPIRIAQPVSGEQMIGVLSDIHFGSKYCRRDYLQDFVQWAVKQGVREFLIPGDVLEGCYRHAQFELSHVGIDEQTDDAIASLPQIPGVSYHAITGNHDFTFTEKTGVDVGNYMVARFAQHGRRDLNFYGNRGAFVQIRGAIVHMWHPLSGPAYARSYKLQKQIENYAVGQKPQLLLTGHWHVFGHVDERGVEGFACGTFQGSGSAFSKALGGSPAIGGMVISWDLTKDGTMRDMILRRRRYFEREEPHRAHVATARIPVDLPGVKARK